MTQADKSICARRYARACVNVFGKEMTHDDIMSLFAIANFLSTNSRILFFLHIPLVDDATKHDVLHMIGSTYNAPAWFPRLCNVLLAHKRGYLIALVCAYSARIYMHDYGIEWFTVTSAHILDEKQKTLAHTIATRLSGRTVVCTFKQDKSIIAGIRMRSDTSLWEHSLKQHLRVLQQRFGLVGDYHGT